MRTLSAAAARQPIDLCCLGIGENGHIAFNDPAVADFSDSRWVKIVRLDLRCRQQQVGEGAFRICGRASIRPDPDDTRALFRQKIDLHGT